MGELQERITSTQRGSITSMQAVYVPADDYTDPAPVATFAHLDATLAWSGRSPSSASTRRSIAGIDQRALEPRVVGQEHYDVARGVQEVLQRYRDLQDIIAILGVDELSEDDRLVVSRARRIQQFLSQPMFVAQQFTGREGRYVPHRRNRNQLPPPARRRGGRDPGTDVLHGRLPGRGARARRRAARGRGGELT